MNAKDSALNATELKQLKDLIDEFEDIIEGIGDLGRAGIVKHVIETLPGTTPIRNKAYNVPVGLRADVRKQLDEMEEHDDEFRGIDIAHYPC